MNLLTALIEWLLKSRETKTKQPKEAEKIILETSETDKKISIKEEIEEIKKVTDETIDIKEEIDDEFPSELDLDLSLLESYKNEDKKTEEDITKTKEIKIIEDVNEESNEKGKIVLPNFNVSNIQFQKKHYQTLLRILSLLLLVWYVTTCFLLVYPDEQGTIFHLGKIVRTRLEPGIYLHLPFPIETGQVYNVEHIRKLELGYRSDFANISEPKFTPISEEALMLTGDENMVDVRFTVQYRIKDIVYYQFGLEEPDKLLRTEALSLMLENISSLSLDELYTHSRSSTEEQVKEQLPTLMDDYNTGILISSINILQVQVPREVMKSYRDVASAHEDSSRIVNVAKGYYQETLNLAKGDSARALEEAKSFLMVKVLKAKGDSSAFIMKAISYRQSPKVTQTRLYLETIERILPNVKKYIKPGGARGREFDFMLIPNETKKNN